MHDPDELLQQYLDAIESGTPLEEVLHSLPEDSSEMAELIRLASAVRTLPHPEMVNAPVQKERILTAARAATVPVAHPKPATPPWYQRIFAAPAARWAFAAAAVVMVAIVAVLLIGSPQNVQAATAMDITGQVEIYIDSQWVPLSEGDLVYSGDHLRTGSESTATLVFYEGSRTTISPNADLTLSVVNGGPGKAIQVVMDQTAGTTEHSVVPLQGKDSTFMVHTSTGDASVRGTSFEVSIINSHARFEVDKGMVLVYNDQNAILLTAGQASTASEDLTITDPAYEFRLVGDVTAVGETEWAVSGVSFNVTPDTVIASGVELGSYVVVKGRTVEGVRIADSISFVNGNQKPRLTFTGTVESISDALWVISGQPVVITSETMIQAGLVVGDVVEVRFYYADNGDWVAEEIERLEEDEVTPTPETTETETVTPEVSETVTETVTETVEDTLEPDTACVGTETQPTGEKLALRYEVPYEEIMGWFCQHYGFGEIDLAYSLAQSSDMTVEEIFAMREAGMGWGAIKAELKPTPTPKVKPTHKPKPTKKP
jgi:ferric-dicitrate binding protein FerR (iron transport regulator)